MKVFLLICGLLQLTLSKECNVPSSAYNLALYSKVCQSSTYDTVPRPVAECAVDNISETDPTKFTCSMTNLEMEPYLTVDLGESTRIGIVHIVNRKDSNYKLLEGADLQIGDSPERDNLICDTITGLEQSQPLLKFFCRGMQGRYVTVVHKGKAGILSVCEIKVYPHIPEPGENMGW